MKNIFKASAVYLIIFLIARYIVKGSSWAEESYTLYTPIVEEILKSFFNMSVSFFYFIIETIEYANRFGTWVIIPRILITLPMHLFAYKIGRKHGLLYAIVYHAMFNYMNHNEYSMIVIYAHVYIIGLLSIIKR